MWTSMVWTVKVIFFWVENEAFFNPWQAKSSGDHSLVLLSWFVGCLHLFIVWEKGIGAVGTGGRLVFTPLSNYPAMGNFTFELVARSHKRTEHNLLFPGSQEAFLVSTPRVQCSQKNVATENYHFFSFFFIILCRWNTRRFPASSALLVIYGFGEWTGLSAPRQLQANVTLSYVHHENPGPDERSLIYEKSGQALSVLPSTQNCQEQRESQMIEGLAGNISIMGAHAHHCKVTHTCTPF